MYYYFWNYTLTFFTCSSESVRPRCDRLDRESKRSGETKATMCHGTKQRKICTTCHKQYGPTHEKEVKCAEAAAKDLPWGGCGKDKEWWEVPGNQVGICEPCYEEEVSKRNAEDCIFVGGED